jgi:signal transduction histidine kinase
MSNVVVPEWDDRSRLSKRQAERGADIAPSAEPALESIEPTLESIEPTLNALVDLLRAPAHCVEAAVFEYRKLPGQPVAAARFACGPGKQPSSSLLTAVIADKRSQIGAPDCFPMGRERANYVVGLRLSEQGVAIAGGYALYSSEPQPRDLEAARAICGLGAKVIAGFRRTRARQQSDAGGQTHQARLAEVLHFAADGYWEADPSGLIRKVILLGSPSDAYVIAQLEGKNLKSIPEYADTLKGNEFRNLKLAVRGPEGALATLKLSAHLLPDGTWQGLARIPRGEGLGPSTVQEARSLVELLRTARDQETVAHRETELILDGLRILTSGRPSREVFKSLLELLAPALEFQDSVVLQRDWSNRISAIAGTMQSLIDASWHETAECLFATEEVAVTLSIPADLKIPVDGFGSALAIKLRGGSKSTVLLCLHRDPHFFVARHLGLGARLSLVASQAFMNEEERQKVVDASKLATIGEMAAGIVHEIRQPLTAMTLAVNNLAEMLAPEQKFDNAKILQKVDRIKTQIERVTKIVANMRVLARHSDGVLEPFSVHGAIDEAVGIVQHKLTTSSIELEATCDEALQAFGNAGEFSQVILNLMSNAHDAILAKPKSGGAGNPGARRVTVLVQPLDTEWLEISVRDTGTGFPKVDAERAFEPFFTTKEPGKGTGLGLALCRRIIENMGGTITLGNWSGGAEIRVKLKRKA